MMRFSDKKQQKNKQFFDDLDEIRPKKLTKTLKEIGDRLPKSNHEPPKIEEQKSEIINTFPSMNDEAYEEFQALISETTPEKVIDEVQICTFDYDNPPYNKEMPHPTMTSKCPNPQIETGWENLYTVITIRCLSCGQSAKRIKNP